MGADVIQQPQAWEVYEALKSDSRVRYFDEPAGIEQQWRELTQKPQPAVKLWTDGYLQAFAHLWNLQVVSFDRGFETAGGGKALILK